MVEGTIFYCKMNVRVFYCIVLMFLFDFHYSLTTNQTNSDEFIPTKEWQIVKPGQKIPPGLHIRSDFQTGITEAKLLDVNSTNTKSGIVLINETRNELERNNSANYSPQQIKTMLKNLKNDKEDVVEINGTKFRSYEKLQEEMQSIQMNIKTDLEIMRDLMSSFRTTEDREKKIDILRDLEYYLHQIDNAQNFVDMDGLSILHNCIDKNDDGLKLEALSCLASALQGNTKVKIEAIKNGTLTRLLVQLHLSKDVPTVNKVLVVLGAITRQFPIAQIAFVNGGGMLSIGKIFDRYWVLDYPKIPLKLVTLISDWLKERSSNDDKFLPPDQIIEKQKQYKKIDIYAILLKEGWCSRFSQMMTSESDLSIDYYEKVINSIMNIYPTCQTNIDRNLFLSFIKRANILISKLMESSSQSDDFYIGDMKRLVSEAARLIGVDDDTHDEL